MFHPFPNFFFAMHAMYLIIGPSWFNQQELKQRLVVMSELTRVSRDLVMLYHVVWVGLSCVSCTELSELCKLHWFAGLIWAASSCMSQLCELLLIQYSAGTSEKAKSRLLGNASQHKEVLSELSIRWNHVVSSFLEIENNNISSIVSDAAAIKCYSCNLLSRKTAQVK